MKPDEKKFTDTVVVRCPERMGAMIGKAAERRFQKPSEYVRQAIVQSVKADGLEFGDPIIMPKLIADIRPLVTTSIPINETQGTATTATSILFGDWKELLIGLRSSLRIEVLKERYAEYHQYAFVAHLRGDVQLAHKASFCRLKGIIL